jgi:PilZ domain
MAIAVERRHSPRTAPGVAGTDVLIMDVEGMWLIPAKLLDISTGGCLVCPGRLFATGRRLRLLFERVPEAGWIDAEMVRRGESGNVGIGFLSRLSIEFLLAATRACHDRRSDSESKTPYLGDVIPTW